MNHVRFNIFADFLRTLLASLIVGLIWSGAAILVVLFLAHHAGAEGMPLEKMEKLADAKGGSLSSKRKDVCWRRRHSRPTSTWCANTPVSSPSM